MSKKVRVRCVRPAGTRSADRIGRTVSAVLLTSAALYSGSLVYLPTASAQQATPAASQGGAVSFSIPSQPLSSAINAFIRASGWQVGYSSAIASGARSQAVSGRMPPAQALQTLLSGTGNTVRMTGPTTATLLGAGAAGNDGTATVEGAIALDTIDVTGGGASGAFTPDTPYETPGSVSHISREQIDRVPPTSAGDLFINTPGVISAGNRVGTSINPNIRGLQGMGRVKTTVDGAQQTSSSYRGYIGNRDETYIDPDIIGGVDITKGPSSGANSGIGGTVAFRTLLPEDIVKDGKSWGVRLKGSLGGNTVDPPDVLATIGSDRPSIWDGNSWSGSIAAATMHENFEFVGAYSKRHLGNYFTGKHGKDENAASWTSPGEEAFNTSEHTESALVKGKVKGGDGQSIELGYVYYNSLSGQIDELDTVRRRQLPLTTTRIGDRGRWPGNDADLLDDVLGLSVDEVNPNSVGCWGLTPPGIIGISGTRYRLEAIKWGEDGGRLDLAQARKGVP